MNEAANMEDNTTKHPVTPCEVIPARELLGDMLLAMKHHQQAVEAYQKDLELHPNRFNGIYGAAIAGKMNGSQQSAKMYFEQLLKLTKSTDVDRPEIRDAKAFLTQNMH